MARRGCRAAFRRWKTCPEGEFSSHEPRERKIDPDERAEPLKAEPRDGDEGGVDGNRVVARPGEDLDGVHDGKAKAFGEARVDAVVLRPGVDEGARGPGLERGLGIPRERGDVDVEARTVAKERAAVRESAVVLERRANPTLPCAVRRRRPSAGANPARQLSLQPVAVGAGEGGNDLV